MGCRTRVFTDVTGKDTPVGRGNLSFTTLNLPMIAHKAKRKAIKRHGEKVSREKLLDIFYDVYNKYIGIAEKQLKQRYEFQRTRKAGNFKFLTENAVWKGTENLGKDDPMGDTLKTGTLAIGFIGLAEALVDLFGKHHGEDEEIWEIGYNMIKHLREHTDYLTERDHLNWGVIATPAEGYAGKSLRKFTAKYGVIENVSDREYFTNSNHIPVYYNIKAIDKVRLEAPFHELTNGGHIAYIELDGEAKRNVKAIDTIVQAMRHYNVGYGSINHSVDTCRDCKKQGIFNDYECPHCGSKNIQKIARITGYLVGDINRWNTGKASELRDRVKHNTKEE